MATLSVHTCQIILRGRVIAKGVSCMSEASAKKNALDNCDTLYMQCSSHLFEYRFSYDESRAIVQPQIGTIPKPVFVHC